MPAPLDNSLAFARRDVRTALSLHALLVITLIVLWFLNQRLGFLESVGTSLDRATF